MKTKQAPAKTTRTREAAGFTDEERSAIRERSRELRSKADGESDLLAKIAEMPEADRRMAERVHAVITAAVPGLTPKTWYGMPAYAKNGSLICFFRGAFKFKTRYATLGFSDKATLDDGNMWPTDFAIKKLTATEEARITALVRTAAG